MNTSHVKILGILLITRSQHYFLLGLQRFEFLTFTSIVLFLPPDPRRFAKRNESEFDTPTPVIHTRTQASPGQLDAEVNLIIILTKIDRIQARALGGDGPEGSRNWGRELSDSGGEGGGGGGDAKALLIVCF